MLSARVDSWLAWFAARGKPLPVSASTRYVDTAAGRIRVFDSGGAEPAVIFVPDGPNVIEHYERLIPLLTAPQLTAPQLTAPQLTAPQLTEPQLTPNLRVVCFDMPGFVNQVLPAAEVAAHALARAHKLAALPASSIRATKALMRGAQEKVVEAQMAEESAHFRKMLTSPEAKEAFTAFFERRRPDFSQFA